MSRSGTMSAPVVRSAGVPYYVQVADILRAQLRDGQWQPGELIPSEAGLCDSFGVSRTAIRQALAALVAEGLLQKEKGRGTFVSRPHVALAVQELRGFYDEMAEQGRAVETRILGQDVITVPPHVAPELGIPMRGRVVRIERVRAVSGQPLVHVRTYLPAPRFARLVEMDLTQRSLYAVLNEEFGVTAGTGRRRIDAVVAEAQQARLLRVKVKSPVLRVTATNADTDGVPFEYFDAWYRADQTSFEIVVAAPAPRTRGGGTRVRAVTHRAPTGAVAGGR